MTKKALKHYSEGEYYNPYYDQQLMPPTQIEIVTPAISNHNRTLQVSANPSELTDSEVVSFFTQFGPIVEVTTPFDKTKNKWKGFLYIIFESAATVNELIKTPTKVINGKKALVAKKATSGPSDLEWTPPLLTTSSPSSLTPSNATISSYVNLEPSSSIVMPMSLPGFSYVMPVATEYYADSSSVSSAGAAGPSGLGGSKMN